jgi:hypothetical protein
LEENFMKTIEEKIEGAVWVLLLSGVNDFLEGIDDDVPALEGPGFGSRSPGAVVEFAAAERTEKERIVRMDAYTVKITINAAASFCYRYAYALDKAIEADWTLGGLAERIQFEKRVYKKTINGGGNPACKAVFNLRVTVEQVIGVRSEAAARRLGSRPGGGLGGE